MARKKPWTITGLRTDTNYPAVYSKEFTVRFWVALDPDPQRPVFCDLTADQADALADQLHARAAKARQRSAEWAER